VAEVNNLPYDTRLTGPGEVAVYGRNNVNVAFMPADRGPDLIDEMRAIHPFEKVYADVLEAGLSIVNPGVHAGPCLLSITGVENSSKRSFFLYEHGVTPSSCRVNVQIDNERKEIGRQLGYTLTPIEDFTGLRPGYTWQELYMSMHGNISLTPISGPHSIDSRYFTEDAPYGLVPWSHIARAVGVATPVIDSVVNIYNVVHEKDWWREGRSADDLGLAGLSVPQIKSYVKTGTV
jgi:opine dehydrogenase